MGNQGVVVTDGSDQAVNYRLGVTVRNSLLVEGAVADGSAVAGSPVLIGGSDGTNVQTLLTDSTGALIVVSASSDTTTVIGPAADGAAVSGNPVRIGGKDSGGLTQDIMTDTSGQIIVTPPSSGQAAGTYIPVRLSGGTTFDPNLTVVGAAADGAAVTGNPVLIAGSDGTNAQTLLTDSTGALIVVSASTDTTTVIGPAADGAAVSGNPVRIAGKDGGGLTQDIATDASGNLTVAGTGTAGTPAGGILTVQGAGSMTALVVSQGTASSLKAEVVGPAADGAAVSGNPVLIAGQDGTNAQSLLTDSSGRLTVIGAAGDGVAVAGAPVLIGGQDGTNAQSMLTDSSGRPVVVGPGTAGTAAGGVLSVQGVASMTPVLVSGAAADGAAVSGNPVLMAGQDGTNAQSLLTDASGRMTVIGAAGDGASVAGAPVLMGGQDGTNAQSILTDTTGRQVVVGAAADGAAVAGNPVLIGGVDGSSNAQTLATDTSGRLTIATIETSVVPGTSGTHLGKAEDAGHTTGDTGVEMLAVRNDADAALSTTDLDYTPVNTDSSGAVKVRERVASTATLSNVASSATNVTLLSANTARRGAIFFNDSTQAAYVKFGATASATSFTYKMLAATTLELPQPVYVGIIDALWDSANGNMRCTEIT